MGRGLVIIFIIMFLASCHDAKVGTGEVTIYKDADKLQQMIASAKPNGVIIVRHSYMTQPGAYVHVTKPLIIVFHPGTQIKGGLYLHEFSDGTQVYDPTLVDNDSEYLLVVHGDITTNGISFFGATELEGVEE